MNQNSFSWYVQDTSGKWYCSVCRACSIQNAYAIGHDKPAKTTNHQRHASSQSHLNAVTRSKLKEQQPMQKLLENKLSKDDETVSILLKAAYHIAKREQPKEEMKHQIDFAIMMGANISLPDSLSYTSQRSVSEFQHAIASTILEDRLDAINNSGVYSLVIDESTDQGNDKRVIMYIQSVSDCGLEYSLLSNAQLKSGSASADNIVKMVVDELDQKGIDISKMVGISTDGASVMTGKKNGVVVQLRNHSESLIGVHCAAHRTALATTQASKDIQEMETYSRTLTSVFRYFANSALRSNRLRQIQEILDLPELKFTEVHSVRWLSMEKAVKSIYRSYPALVMCLERDARLDSTAKGLYNEVSQYKFIAITHMMMDILPFIGRLSKVFQSRELDYSVINPKITSTCESLVDMLECEGVFVDKLNIFVKEVDGKAVYARSAEESVAKNVESNVRANNEFDGFSDNENGEKEESENLETELKFYTQQKSVLQKVMPEYIHKLTNNLESRFEDTSKLAHMNAIVPRNIVASKSLAKYGMDDFKHLVSQFSVHLEGDLTTCTSEYQQYKRLVAGSYKTLSVVEMMVEVGKSFKDTLPNMYILLKCCAVIPMTSVQCERGFSTQNRLKSKFRTRMNNETLDDLMRISEDGPKINEFDFPRALKKWKSCKIRKIYQH